MVGYEEDGWLRQARCRSFTVSCGHLNLHVTIPESGVKVRHNTTKPQPVWLVPAPVEQYHDDSTSVGDRRPFFPRIFVVAAKVQGKPGKLKNGGDGASTMAIGSRPRHLKTGEQKVGVELACRPGCRQRQGQATHCISACCSFCQDEGNAFVDFPRILPSATRDESASQIELRRCWSSPVISPWISYRPAPSCSSSGHGDGFTHAGIEGTCWYFIKRCTVTKALEGREGLIHAIPTYDFRINGYDQLMYSTCSVIQHGRST